MDDIQNTPEASTPPLHSVKEVDAYPDSRTGRSPVEDQRPSPTLIPGAHRVFSDRRTTCVS